MILITQPNFDITTQWISCWSTEISKLATDRKIKVVVLDGIRANRKEFESVIKKISPKLVFFNGHGSDKTVFGHKNEPLVIMGDNEDQLAGKIVYSLACLSAKTLGPECINKGTRAYIGYIEDFIFFHDITKISNPLSDQIAGMFLEPSNCIMKSLIKGHTTQMSWEHSQQCFKRKITELVMKGDRVSINTYLPHLFWDMQNQVSLGDPNASL
ncbi:MAG: hypothetical protein UV68_C0002G0011 [Candidatus Collierbacteria bacterium GW2011_GWC2_43_12]|uniref:CHAT domain-containing protein n=1 Tax=Candidatus Collierbacteria bacterium GW2011_GWC2_43_12 TaxID=1618390 RepID=A0A0G1FI88_9BACT|nr:MAG: hypothetical protein UV68_C0002G0011 [Candidatus Collierbacteria bacterium GW2011_GWC2_43_12]KKT83195.1 MAG: hypothetical protein UW80_C0019G0005 [Microgenomates group bacterium GW2011_GWC1_44_9]